MNINAWLGILLILIHGTTEGQQQPAQYIPVQAPILPGAAQSASSIPYQQAVPSVNTVVPVGSHPGIPQYIAESPVPAYATASSDPLHTGGVALNLVVNAGPGPASAPTYTGPGPVQQLQQPPITPAANEAQLRALPGNSPVVADTATDAHRAHDLPDQIMIDGHQYKLNDGHDLVVIDRAKDKHNVDGDDEHRRRRDGDDDRERDHKRDDDDDDRFRHKDHDRNDDNYDEKPRKKDHDSTDNKPKKKEGSKPTKAATVAKLPDLPATPNIPSVPTFQPIQEAILDPTKTPIHPGQDVDATQPPPAAAAGAGIPEADAAPTNATEPSAAPPPVPTGDLAGIRPADRPAPSKRPEEDPVAPSTQPTPAPSVEQASATAPIVKSTPVDAEVVRAEPETAAPASSEPPGDPAGPTTIAQPMMDVATLAPLSLPQSPGQWASPLPRNEQFENAKSKVASRPSLAVSAAGAPAKPIGRPGQVPELPNLPPGMEAFHRRPDAVKKGPPMPPVPKPMMPKPNKPGPVNNSNAENKRPMAASGAPSSQPSTASAMRQEPVPVIALPETKPVVVDTPAPVPVSPAPTSEPAKKTKWSFGHGPEYNYEPSSGRKPADQTNGDPFGNKPPNENDKKKTDGKNKAGADDKDKKSTPKPDGKVGATGAPDQNKAVSNMFSNIMGKIKF